MNSVSAGTESVWHHKGRRHTPASVPDRWSVHDGGRGYGERGRQGVREKISLGAHQCGDCWAGIQFLMAFVFAFILLCNIGYDLPVLAGVTEGYPAEEAGMQAGDTILKIDHTRIHFFRDISAYTQFHSGDAVTVTYERDGERYQTVLTPKYNEEYGYYMYGFQGSAQKTKGSVLSNLKYSVYEVEYWIRVTIDSLKSLVGGKVSVNDMSGPVGIVNMIGDSYEQSVTYGYYMVFLQMLYITIFLSANLGVMNLLPLPALDGGRLLFLIVEVIRGKRVDPDKEGMVHFIGMMLLFALMFFTFFNDIRKLFG